MATPKLTFPMAQLSKLLPPERFAEEVMQLEAELTQLHPVWRSPVGRTQQGIMGTRGIPESEVELRSRVKWLLQRRAHLYNNTDYDVKIISTINRAGQAKLYAIPVIRKVQHTAESIAAAGRRSMLVIPNAVLDKAVEKQVTKSK